MEGGKIVKRLQCYAVDFFSHHRIMYTEVNFPHAPNNCTDLHILEIYKLSFQKKIQSPEIKSTPNIAFIKRAFCGK